MPQSRDRYLDALRAAAIVRVILFHMFGWTWLSYAFPAMGVMFALGGSLMAASLDRAPARAVVTSRLRRTLPALWAFGLVMVIAMFWHGGAPHDLRLLLWIVPVATPPASAWAVDEVAVVWYLATYTWLVLLSPLALRAFRRFPVATTVTPLLVLAATQLGPVAFYGRVGEVPVNVATFAACWFVGFAHRTGQLRRISRETVFTLAAAGLAAGAYWAHAHPSDDGAFLNDIPLAQGLYSLGFVLIVLRFTPSMGWLGRVRPLDGFVTLVNARAVTIYLWHNAAINLAFVVGDVVEVWRLGDRFANVGYLAVAIPLLAVAVLALGWIEDLAARRRPRLVPALRQPSRHRAPAPPGPRAGFTSGESTGETVRVAR
jgi:peptidoglycan-N-acetylglucosamine deacetylase